VSVDTNGYEKVGQAAMERPARQSGDFEESLPARSVLQIKTDFLIVHFLKTD
jgi:hypothetical protein